MKGRMRAQLKRKTKIVATLGPASKTKETIRGMIDAGMDAARLNFSHGTHEEHLQLLKTVREESEAAGRHVAVFQDLSGPKLRIGKLTEGEITLEDGAHLELSYAPDGDETSLGNEQTIYISIFNPGKVMKRGERALLADGRVELLLIPLRHGAGRCASVVGVRLGLLVRTLRPLEVPAPAAAAACVVRTPCRHTS